MTRQGNLQGTAKIAIGTTATLLSSNGQWVGRIFVNEGPSAIRIGDSTVTYNGTSGTDGILLAVGATFADDVSLTAWYAVCAAATTASVSVAKFV